MPYDDTRELIRDALDRTEGISADRIVIDLREGDAVELLGAVATPEEASLAATVAARFTETVHNHIVVDRNLREDPTGPLVEPGDRAEAPPRNADLSVQTSAFQPESVPEDGTPDVDRALAENIAWDPPDDPVESPTPAEQRGVVDHDGEVEEAAPAGDLDDSEDRPRSLDDMTRAELEHDARPAPSEDG